MKNRNNKQKGCNPKRKGKDQFSKRQRDVESMDMRSDDRLPKGGDNDWRWYARTPELVKSYASFPFGVATGNFMQYNVPLQSWHCTMDR